MKIRRFSALLLVVALVAAACGGNDDPGTNAANDLLNEAAEEAPEEAAENAGVLNQEQCLEIATAMASAAGATSAGAGGTAEDPTAVVDSFQAMADVAPAEIADDLQFVASAFQEYFDILAGAGIDFSDPSSFSTAEGSAALTEAANVMSAPEVQEALDNVSTGLEDLCGTDQ